MKVLLLGKLLILFTIYSNTIFHCKKQNPVLNKSFKFNYIANLFLKKIDISIGIGFNSLKDFRKVRKFYTKEFQNTVLYKYFKEHYTNTNDFLLNKYYEKIIIDHNFLQVLKDYVDIDKSTYIKQSQCFSVKFNTPLYTLEPLTSHSSNNPRLINISANNNKQSIEEINNIHLDNIKKAKESTSIKKDYKNLEKSSLNEIGLMKLFAFSTEVTEKNNVYSIKLNNKELLHGGTMLLGEKKQTFTHDENNTQYKEYKTHQNQINLFAFTENHNAWFDTVRWLAFYSMIEPLGYYDSNQNTFMVYLNAMKNLNNPDNKFNSNWFGQDKKETVLSTDVNINKEFYKRFKSKGFGFIEREYYFEEINPQASELLSATDLDHGLIPNIALMLSFETMLLYKEKPISLDLLFQCDYIDSNYNSRFMGSVKENEYNYQISLILRMLSNHKSYSKNKWWLGIQFVLCPKYILCNKRLLINQKFIDDFIATNTENPNGCLPVLTKFSTENPKKYTITPVVMFQFGDLKILLTLFIWELSKGILQFNAQMFYSQNIWRSSSLYIEKMMIALDEIEEEKYMEKMAIHHLSP